MSKEIRQIGLIGPIGGPISGAEHLRIGDLVFFEPKAREREMVPVLEAVAEGVGKQVGVTRIFPGDVLEVVRLLRSGWLLCRYPKEAGELLVDSDYCRVWKQSETSDANLAIQNTRDSNDIGVVVQCPCAADGFVRNRPVKLLRREPEVWAEIQFLDTGGLSFCEWWEFKPND
jgi:hypothetical protein